MIIVTSMAAFLAEMEPLGQGRGGGPARRLECRRHFVPDPQ